MDKIRNEGNEKAISPEQKIDEVSSACKVLESASESRIQKSNEMEANVKIIENEINDLKLDFIYLGKEMPVRKKFNKATVLENLLVAEVQNAGLDYITLSEKATIFYKTLTRVSIKLTPTERLFISSISDIIDLNGLFYRRFSKLLPHSESIKERQRYMLAVLDGALKYTFLEGKYTQKDFKRMVAMGDEVRAIATVLGKYYDNIVSNFSEFCASDDIDIKLITNCSQHLTDAYKHFLYKEFTTQKEMEEYREKFGGYVITSKNTRLMPRRIELILKKAKEPRNF